MLISKFNRLIHNKFIWAVFAILISLSMVGLFAPRPETETSQQSGLTLFDEPVTQSEISIARLFAQSFRPTAGGEAMQRQLQEDALKRIAMLRYADELGFSVTDQELSATIQQDPSFAVDGVFNLQQYQALIQQQLGIPISLFEDYIRQELIISRLRAMVGNSLWIPPSDLDKNASRFTDSYTVEYIKLDNANLIQDVSVDEQEIRAAFTEYPDEFRVPEQRTVAYVTFPHSAFRDRVAISEDQIEQRYDLNIDQYEQTDTNTMTVSFTPLEEVRDDIRTALEKEEAAALALDAAMMFVDDLSMMEESPEISIQSVAADRKTTVYTSEWFNATTPLPDVSAGLSFNEAAFQLEKGTPELTYSFSIPGTNAVYVMQIEDIKESYVPELEDVYELAEALAEDIKRTQLMTERIDEIHNQIAADTLSQSFSNVVADAGFSMEIMGPLVVAEADPEEIPYFGELIPEILPLETGELTEPIAIADGALIGYLANREPAPLEEKLAIKPDINQMMMTARQGIHFDVWSNDLLAKAQNKKN